MTVRRTLSTVFAVLAAVALAIIAIGAITIATAGGDLSTFMRGDAMAAGGTVLLLLSTLGYLHFRR
jgi:hypothetical protein